MTTTTGKHAWENRWFIGSVSVWFTLSVIGAIISHGNFDWIQLGLSAFCFFGTFFERRRHLGHF
jgi:hypothetical protein